MEIWRKNLYVLWGTQFLAMVGMNLVVPFLPFFVRELGVTNPDDLARWSGMVFSGPFIVAFFATPIWTRLGDRFGRKTMVVRALFGLALSQAFIGFSQNVYHLFLFRMLQGGISGFIAATLMLVSTATPKAKAGYALGLLQSSQSAGTILGPFIGGILADMMGYRQVFFVTAGLCTIGGFVIIKYVTEVEQPPPEEDRPSILQNVRYIFSHPQMRIIMFAIVLCQASALMIESIFALFVESLQANARMISTLTGGIFSISGAFMLVSAPWWGKRNDRMGFRKNLTIAMGVTGIAYALHMVMPNLAALAALRAMLGFFRGGILPALYAITSLYAPDSRKSALMGIATSSAILGNMVGPLLGGTIASQFGIKTVFAFNSILFLFTAFMVWKNMADLRGHDSPQVPETEVVEG